MLVKREKSNELSANYHAKPFHVLEKKGNSVLIQSEEGVRYRRNITNLKKFEERKENSDVCAKSEKSISVGNKPNMVNFRKFCAM